MIHALKTLPEYFEAVVKGEKLFEVRKNDAEAADKLKKGLCAVFESVMEQL